MTWLEENNVRLPTTHLTYLLQPLDFSVFKPVKSAWVVVTGEFVRRERRAITGRDFPNLLSEVGKLGTNLRML